MERDTEMKEQVYFRNMEQSWIIGKCCVVGSARRVEKTKTGLKLTIHKTKIIPSYSITLWQIEGEKL